MDSMAMRCDFKAGKRQYVHKLSQWRVGKNNSSGKASTPRCRPFFDPGEFDLCLAKGDPVFNSYWNQACLMMYGKQDLDALLFCARAVETQDQAGQLMALIDNCIERQRDDGDVEMSHDGGDERRATAYLGILRGYVLHQVGLLTEEVRLAVSESAQFLLHSGATGPSPDRPRTSYAIDIPNLMLIDYGLGMSSTDRRARQEKVMELLLEQLPDPGSPATCESMVHDCLKWAIEKLAQPSASRVPTSILEVPCRGVNGAAWKAIVHVFSFLLSEHIAGLDEPGGAWRPTRAFSGLRISSCDLLVVLVAMVLTASPSESVALPDFPRLCASPPELIATAAERAKKWASRKDLLLAGFLVEYNEFTYPEKAEEEEREFFGEVFESAKKVMQGLTM